MAIQKIFVAMTVILMLAGCITAQTAIPQSKADCPSGTHFIKVDGQGCGVDVITSGNSTCATKNWCKRNDKDCADYDANANSCQKCEDGYDKKHKGTETYCKENAAYSALIWIGVALAGVVIFSIMMCVCPALCCAISVFECLCDCFC